MPDSILAKSWKQDQGPLPTLAWHTRWVMDAGDHLLAVRGISALRAAGLPDQHMPLLARIVRFAAWWHDLGKCSEHFQRMLKGTGTQPFRHEAVSWYLAVGPLAEFLATHLPDATERWLVAACLAGHHRKFHGDFDDGSILDPNGSTILHLDHPDVNAWIRLAPDGLQDEAPRFASLTLSAATLKQVIEDHWLTFDEGHPGLDLVQSRLLSLSKAFLLAADMAGSALPKEGKTLDWIDRALGTRATLQERMTLLDKKLDRMPLRAFQEATADSDAPWTFLKAGCGTGKTAAACAWAARQHTGRQLWLTYPTTGTATEGYLDYVLNAEVEGALLHSRAAFDLALIGTPDDPEDESQARELALRGWSADTVVATVDTVLGLIQNQRAGHYAYPGICEGALVFDELHAYDERLFGCLLRFLEAHPGLPCLFMTASLPAGRFKALNDLCLRLQGRPLAVIPGPEALEALPRYIQVQDDPWRAVSVCLGAGGKVLWVSNIVKRASRVADEADARGWEPLRYHSRYRYLDRLHRHRDVIQAFKREGPALVCSTQVAEMSLDLSADLLVTDLAPIPALIQRLGRLNRRAEAGMPARPFIVLEPGGSLPYESPELEDARAWLGRLGSTPLSQADLLTQWEQKDDPGPRISSNWLDEALWTRPGSVREGSPSITVLLEEDLPKIQKRENPACAYLLSMPVRRNILPRLQSRDRFLVASPDLITYDPQRGAEWR